MEYIIYDNKKIEYEIIRANIRNIYIQIKEGNVFVKAPKKVSKEYIHQMMLKKSKWIIRTLEKTKEKKRKKEIEYVSGEIFKILGKEYTLKIAFEYIKKVIQELYMEIAKEEYHSAIEELTNKVGLIPNKVKIKNIKSAWGSCSSKKVITLSLHLVQHKREIIQYVILHELCHLKHMNHSKDFWNLVGQYIPEYKVYRKELKA
jgi:predicted metal-dependent hydrolase